MGFSSSFSHMENHLNKSKDTVPCIARLAGCSHEFGRKLFLLVLESWLENMHTANKKEKGQGTAKLM